ncbi:hypothetical protein [Deinococcus soli (ex Cha et al. 2016)]|uniref:Uncharacterized protein n=2 Tax=Deinococcus soli (ex Cha et al. 2016) TaxID=1309411 RepID=A0ACC6KGX0_9DEIO|nr:hypothetical protein [Deinococcus soli (ex Cha et al. 2016)]MDR6218121.1 hypothetical protein [Deinococcus soli (ex Cha et al. 2016)]MDR6328861.1 hypothetical protein [Deinococcus soli (ex Cha et al. 2016)]MDR6751651.1 hypothetical protein [Deinococcus soli (ex Cha et al. 2016)]
MLFSLIYFGILVLIGVTYPRTDRYGQTHPQRLWRHFPPRQRDTFTGRRRPPRR